MGANHRRPRSGVTARFPALVVVAGAAVLGVAIAVVVGGRPGARPRPAAPRTTERTAAATPARPAGTTRAPVSARGAAAAPWSSAPAPAAARGHSRPGSVPAALPGPVLIADKLNDRLLVVDPYGRIRWQFPRPGDLAPGQTFRSPDDAFFSADGRDIVVTQEDRAVISVIDVAAHRIVYRYGIDGHPGAGANHLSNPDDALMLPDGRLLAADIQNCRIVLLAPPSHRPNRILGETTTACRHAPPTRWGSPNGVFPASGGRYLVTEINGDWVDSIDLAGKVFWSVHPPGVAYPSDTNEIAPGRYVTVDYSAPGQVVIFDAAGRLIWHYAGAGRGTLDHPSLALHLPNGEIIATDDFHHRVVVIDPRTDRVVWQYGVTGVAGSRPGYLDNPDGLDLVPPHALLETHAAAGLAR